MQEPTLRTNQDFVHTSPPSDEFLFVLMTRSILIHQPEESPPWESTTDHHPVNETPVHPVEPVLGTTLLENCWLQNRKQPQDITDILGMTAYDGYV